MNQKVKDIFAENNLFTLFILAFFMILILLPVFIWIDFLKSGQDDKPEHPEFTLWNETCLEYGTVHYDKETCLECVTVVSVSLNSNSRWYDNERKKNNSFIDSDAVEYRKCRSND